jgi:membrane-bound lytic murein transglycosylase D
MFDDWLLTLAAYNSGPARVLSAIKKSGSRNFWELQQFLPEETRMHVKKFIAMHYYFEGHGSLVTLTKAETKAHIEAVADFVKRQEQIKADSLVVKPETVAR